MKPPPCGTGEKAINTSRVILSGDENDSSCKILELVTYFTLIHYYNVKGN